MKSLAPFFHKISKDDDLFQEPIYDAYKVSTELPELSVCLYCGAVYQAGSGCPCRKIRIRKPVPPVIAHMIDNLPEFSV
jgi:hypothetical protein